MRVGKTLSEAGQGLVGNNASQLLSEVAVCGCFPIRDSVGCFCLEEECPFTCMTASQYSIYNLEYKSLYKGSSNFDK